MREGWEIRPLEDCITFIKNGANIKQTKSGLGYPITRIETLSGGKFNRDKMGYADIFELGKYSGYVLNDGDILLSHINSKSYVGRSVVYSKIGDEVILHGMNLLRIITKKDFSPFYFQYYSCTPTFKKQISSIRKDAVNQSSVAIGDLKRVSVPVPSIQEQEKIVAELDCLTGIIEKKKQQLKELDNLAQSIFYEMFGDPIANDKGWAMKKLKDVAEIVGGSTPKTSIEEYWNGENPWVSPAELHQNHYISSTERGISNEAAKNMILLPVGTVLLSSRAPIGKVSITTIPMYCNQGFKNVVCSHFINNEYVYQLLLGKTEYLNALGTGATFKEISKKTTENIRIAVPPIDLQEEFAVQAIAIEKQKELIWKSLSETETLFNSRMDFWFN